MGMYDQPAQSNIVNTYVPIPFEEILQAGQARQGRYDQTLAALQAQEDAINRLPYVAGGEEEAYVKSVISNVDSLARQAINKDLSQGINRRWLQDQLRNKVNVNLLTTIGRNKESYDKARQAEFELRRSNQYYEPYELENDPYKNGSLKLGQTYDYIPQAMTDPDKILADYFYSIPEDAYTHIDPKTGQIKDVVTKTKDKLLNALANDVDTLALNPSMKWMVEQYRKNHPGSEDMSVRDIVMERAKESIKGGRFTFTRSRDAGFVPGMGKENKDKPTFAGSNNTQKLINTNLTDPKELSNTIGFNPTKIKDPTDLFKHVNLDDKGMLQRKIAERPKYLGEIGYNIEKHQKQFDEEYNKNKKLVDDIRRFNPELKGTSDGELLNAYASAYNRMNEADYNTYMYNTEGGSASMKSTQSDLIKDNLGGRDIISGENKTKGGIHVESINDIYKMFNIKEGSKDRNKDNIKLVSIVPALGMYQASIEANGVPREFMISMNKEEQAITRLAVEANRIQEKGKIGEETVIGGDGKKYVVTTGIQPIRDEVTGQVTYGFGSNVRTADGSNAFIDMMTGEPTNNLPLNEYEQFVAAQLNTSY